MPSVLFKGKRLTFPDTMSEAEILEALGGEKKLNPVVGLLKDSIQALEDLKGIGSEVGESFIKANEDVLTELKANAEAIKTLQPEERFKLIESRPSYGLDGRINGVKHIYEDSR